MPYVSPWATGAIKSIKLISTARAISIELHDDLPEERRRPITDLISMLAKKDNLGADTNADTIELFPNGKGLAIHIKEGADLKEEAKAFMERLSADGLLAQQVKEKALQDMGFKKERPKSWKGF